MTRRAATTLRAIVPVDKPAGCTSHDVVARVRRATGEGRVGHAGTLDPMATGVLVVLIGPYTRLEPYLAGADKTYEARIDFGTETDTDDAEGATICSASVPSRVLDESFARSVLGRFIGPALQAPPAFSAIKVGGKIAHREARQGRPIVLEPRSIEVFEARLNGIDAAAASWNVTFRASKGTYVRALARDIGRACESAAHLGALRRTASGSITLAEATGLDRTLDALASGQLAAVAVDPVAALGLPVVTCDAGATRDGAALGLPPVADIPDGAMVSIVEDGILRGIYRRQQDRLIAVVVLPDERAA